MKKNLLWFFGLAIMAATSFTIVSCNDDPCKDVKCGDNGTCFDGACECNQGYEGTNCDVEWKTKYLGNYNTAETCVGSTAIGNFSNTITQGADAFTLSISNFGDSGAFGTATISTAGTVTIASQTITISGNAITVTGDGTYADGKLTIHYTGTGGGVSFDCTDVMTKQ